MKNKDIFDSIENKKLNKKGRELLLSILSNNMNNIDNNNLGMTSLILSLIAIVLSCITAITKYNILNILIIIILASSTLISIILTLNYQNEMKKDKEKNKLKFEEILKLHMKSIIYKKNK